MLIGCRERRGCTCLYAGSLVSEAVQLHLYRNGEVMPWSWQADHLQPQPHLREELCIPENPDPFQKSSKKVTEHAQFGELNPIKCAALKAQPG